MTILVLLLIFAILSISSVSANDVDNNLAIDENSLSSSDMVSLDDSYNLESGSQDSDILETEVASEQFSDDEIDDGDDSGDGGADSPGDGSGDGGADPSIDNPDENAELNSTDLTVVDSNVIYGQNLEVVLSSNDNSLADQNITFEINGTNHTALTDSSGKAGCEISLVPGAYDITVYYLGNDQYAPSSKAFTINVLKITPVFTVSATEVMKGYYLYVFLKDAKGNPINGVNVTIDIGGNKYSITTSNGKAGLKIKLDPKKYGVKLSYAGDEIHDSASKSFNLNVVKNQPYFKYNSKISTLNYLTVYLKDGAYKPIANKKITIKIGSTKYTRTTDSNGRARVYVKKLPGKYKVKLYYKGNAIYSAVSKSYTLKVVKKATAFTVKNTTVVKGKYLYVYLKDANGKALKNKKVTIRLNGKKYVKTTNSNGRVSLKVSLKAGSYKVKLYYSGSKYYKAKSKSLTMNVVKSTSVYKSANGCIWLWNSLKNEVNFKTLKNNGIKNIFISYVAVESSDFDSWLEKANSYGMKVHIWMQAFYDKKWINPILSDGSVNNTLLNKIARNAESYAKIKGVSGVHLDYIRFPGTAYKYKNGEKAVSELARKVSESVKQVNSSIVVSCSVMGESLYSNSYYYGQNLTKLSQYVDVIVPMLYKGNYGQSSSWIKTQTASYVKAVGSNAKIWVGLQSYKSDDDLTKLSISALSQDAANAIKGGANGIALFRYGLTNFINMTRIIA